MKEKNREKGKESVRAERERERERKRRNDVERGKFHPWLWGPSAPSDGVALLKDEGKFTARVEKGENLLLVVDARLRGRVHRNSEGKTSPKIE